jgi:site-specific recombinase XerC
MHFQEERTMRDPDTPLERQLISILAANREGAYSTQRKRGWALSSAGRALHERFGLQKWSNLGAKHVAAVVEAWKAADQGRRDIESKLSHLRWLVRKIGKANLMPRSNAEMGIAPGPRHTRAGKVIPDGRFDEMLSAVPEERIKVLMLLARYLGLRFKEAALFRPGRDWQGSRVWVKRGTKGGRPRYLWLHNPRQAEVLRRALAIASGDQAIIPAEAPTFEKWRQHVYRVLRAAGVGRATDATFHDLRRGYLVRRMTDLVKVKGMDRDRAAALVAREAGHGRTEILQWYLEEEDLMEAA